MSQVFQLFRLQKIDTQADQITARINAIETELKENIRLREAESDWQRDTKKLHAANIQLKKIEDDVVSTQIKIEQAEAALYGGKVKNPKELQDMQEELTSLKKRRKELEERHFEALLNVEAAEGMEQQTRKKHEEVKNIVFSRNSLLEGEKSKITASLDILSRERTILMASIQQNSLEIYERLRKQKRGIAVTSITDFACEACGAEMTPAEEQIARSANQINTCRACGRILYAG